MRLAEDFGAPRFPPDVPGAVHGLPTERHEAGVRVCPDGDAVAWPKDEKLRGTKDIACNLNLAGDSVVDGSLIVDRIERHRCAGAEPTAHDSRSKRSS